MFYAFTATLISAATLVAQKFSLSRLNINNRVFNFVIFFFLALTAFLWSLNNKTLPSKEFFQGTPLLLLIVLLLLAFSWNALFSYALQKEEMSESELIISFSPIITILLAFLFLPEERNYFVFFPALIAGIFLVWANIDHHHLDFSRQERILAVAVLGIAVEAIIIKELLYFISPEALYALRCAGVLPLFALLIAVKPGFKPNLNPLQTAFVGLIGFLATIQMVFFYRAYQTLGVTETTLISLLAPVLVFIFTPYFLKEKIKTRQWIALVVIVVCIAVSQLLFKT